LTAAYDFDIDGVVGGDQAPPRGKQPVKTYWSIDGRSVFVVSGEEGRTNLKRVDVETGKTTALTERQLRPVLLSLCGRLIQSGSPDLHSNQHRRSFHHRRKSGKLQQITHINGELFAKLNLTEPEMIWYKSFDGRRIQAWVQRPADFQSGKKYPMILDIHGGPHARLRLCVRP